MPCGRNYYQILAVSRKATLQEVKSAFHKRAKEWHPDLHPELGVQAVEMMKQINKAYDIFSDDSKRAAYARDHPAHDYVRRKEPPRPPPKPQPKYGDDLYHSLDISWVEAVAGGERRIEVLRAEVCAKCQGTGLGQAPSTACVFCHGSGLVKHARAIVLKIPRTLDTSKRIKLTGKGHAGAGGGAPGDLYVQVSIALQEKVPFKNAGKRSKPALRLFLVDQSATMSGHVAKQDARSKAAAVADVINRRLRELVLEAYQGNVAPDDTYIGVIGYADNVGTVLPTPVNGDGVSTARELASCPRRIETRKKRTVGGSGRLTEENITFPVWMEPVAEGPAPMCEALRQATSIAERWCARHPVSTPPLIINISSSSPSDGDPAKIAAKLKTIKCGDDPLCLVNIHLSEPSKKEIALPDNPNNLPDGHARMLFDMSSPLPRRMAALFSRLGYKASDSSRAFVCNARLETAMLIVHEFAAQA